MHDQNFEPGRQIGDRKSGARALVGDFRVVARADDSGIVEAHGDPHIMSAGND